MLHQLAHSESQSIRCNAIRIVVGFSGIRIIILHLGEAFSLLAASKAG
jgi:hypothetical protein